MMDGDQMSLRTVKKRYSMSTSSYEAVFELIDIIA